MKKLSQTEEGRSPKTIRKEALARRKAIQGEDRKAKEQALAAQLMPFLKQARRPGLFLKTGSEPDLSPLFSRTERVLVPKVVSDTEMVFYLYDPARIHSGAFGISEPDESYSPEEAKEPDLLVVPLSAFCRTNRLGYGKGYYDRYLAAHPGILSIGAAFDEQETVFEPESWDVPLDFIATPTRLLARSKKDAEVKKGKM